MSKCIVLLFSMRLQWSQIIRLIYAQLFQERAKKNVTLCPVKSSLITLNSELKMAKESTGHDVKMHCPSNHMPKKSLRKMETSPHKFLRQIFMLCKLRNTLKEQHVLNMESTYTICKSRIGQ